MTSPRLQGLYPGRSDHRRERRHARRGIWEAVVVATGGLLLVSVAYPATVLATPDPPIGTPSTPTTPIPQPTNFPLGMMLLIFTLTVVIAMVTTLATLHLQQARHMNRAWEAALSTVDREASSALGEYDLDILQNEPRRRNWSTGER